MDKKIKVLFVCTGNICRSPLAHRLFEKIVAEKSHDHAFEVDSCGIGSWHMGQNSDRRMREKAREHGLFLEKYARGIEYDDIGKFDYLIGMDHTHISYIKSISRNDDDHKKMFLMRDFDDDTSDGKDVPDPYYDGKQGFSMVYNIIDRSCKNLHLYIANKHALNSTA